MQNLLIHFIFTSHAHEIPVQASLLRSFQSNEIFFNEYNEIFLAVQQLFSLLNEILK